MNERIKELAEQAEQSVKWGDPHNYDDYNRAFDEWQEKFAELIVRECADRIDDLITCDDDGNQILDEPKVILTQSH